MKKIKFISMLMIAALMVACQPAEETSSEEEVGGAQALPLVNIEKAKRGTFTHKVKVQGDVNTDDEVVLNSEMGGQIKSILVSEGDKVSKGQALIRLDVAMLESSRKEIKSQLEFARYMLKKQDQLRQNDLGSEVEYESALNQVNTLESKLNSLNTQQAKTVITAPFNGVVDAIFAKNGQVVGPQSAVLRLVNNANVYITADLSEKYISSISVGSKMSVSFPNYSDTVMKMEVSSVGNFIHPTNRTVRIRADIKNNQLLLPNMLAEIEVTDQEIEKALMIPAISIIKDQDNKDFVYVAIKEGKDNYKIDKAEIAVLKKYDGVAHIKVLKGKISNKTMVVTEGARGVAVGDLVRIK